MSRASTREYLGPEGFFGSILKEYADGALVEVGRDMGAAGASEQTGTVALPLVASTWRRWETARRDLLR